MLDSAPREQSTTVLYNTPLFAGDTGFENSAVASATRLEDGDDATQLSLAVGSVDQASEFTFEAHSQAPASTVVIVDDPRLAMGYYLTLYEIHGRSEDATHELLRSQLARTGYANLYKTFLAETASMTEQDRKHWLLDQVTEELERSPYYEPVMDSGSWRDTGLTGAGERLAKTLVAELDSDPGRCYENAQRVVHDYDGDSDRVQYVEGVAMNKHAARVTEHAWIEVDERVVEVTWPWSDTTDPSDNVYFGVDVSNQEVPEPGTDAFSTPIVLGGQRDG